MTVETSIALGRFGLGPSPRTPDAVRTAPREWVQAQVRAADVPQALRMFPSSASTMKALGEAAREGTEALKRVTGERYREVFAAEVMALVAHRVTTDAPFLERMVMFWSNHFTVSRAKAVIGPAIPAFEREAIRPHVFGRFEDMLLAAASHPVMLDYLDNHLSVGPASPAGQRSGRSLNENLARELLELHTLGVNGGYTQQDVRAFAQVLTGWTHGGVAPRKSTAPITGTFVYRDRMHEPGPKRVLGRRYESAGIEQGRAVLRALARHPSTASFVATKLVRHFVADAPPAADVARIATVFLDTQGDLAAVSRAVVQLGAAWETALPKVKSPVELVISTHRALGMPSLRRDTLLVPLKTLGQVPFSAASPQGWPDTADHWLSPESLKQRIAFARAIAARSTVSPDELLTQFAPIATDQLRTWMSRAPSGDAAVALLLASPTFQRR